LFALRAPTTAVMLHASEFVTYRFVACDGTKFREKPASGCAGDAS
jgi:hypothetical protein